jgi:hypothetical protein
MSVMHEIKTVVPATGAAVAAGAGSLWGGLSSACDQIESLQFLHGNGSGDIIYEISGNAYAYLQAMFQGCKDPSKYGLYINTQAPKC